MMKYREIYDKGVKILQNAGIEEAALDARLLLEYVCGTDRNDLLVHGDREVFGEQCADFLQLVEKRSTHIPLQHLTGTTNFMGLDFKVNEHVLIPRQDTEILVEEVLKDLHDGMRILDMCTGSGCILISLLHYSNHCVGVGVDLSEDALKVAAGNAGELLPEVVADGGITFVQSNLFEGVEGKFEVLVSNPPYIPARVCETLMPEVKDHEPHMALDGGEDGLDFYRAIIEQAPAYLCGGGGLYFEIGYDQGEAVSELMRSHGFKEVNVIRDYAGLDRVVRGTLGLPGL